MTSSDVPGGTNLAINAVRILAAVAVVVSHARTLLVVDYSASASTSVLTQGRPSGPTRCTRSISRC